MMIRQLRLKFIAISMSALILLLIIVFVTINTYMQDVATDQVDEFLEDVVANGGYIMYDEPPAKEIIEGEQEDLHLPSAALEVVRGFSVILNEEGSLIQVLTDTSNEGGAIKGYVASVMSTNLDKGDLGAYRYTKVPIDQGYLVVFANTELQNELLRTLLSLSYFIGGVSLIVLFVFIVVLSRYVTKPVEMAFYKQKRFIADSSHELKTPLSIMSANLGMLEMEVGNNKRIDALNQGVKRMNKLVLELLILARTEDGHKNFRDFDLGKVMESTILALEVIAFEHGNTIETSIESGVLFQGDEEGIRKMVGALMENAIKYAYQKTTIKAKLYTKGDARIMEIYNEGIGVEKKHVKRLFDKFYRVDQSRDRMTGGHGIGLSIVKNVVDLHKGKIVVDSVAGKSILFRITL